MNLVKYDQKTQFKFITVVKILVIKMLYDAHKFMTSLQKETKIALICLAIMGLSSNFSFKSGTTELREVSTGETELIGNVSNINNTLVTNKEVEKKVERTEGVPAPILGMITVPIVQLLKSEKRIAITEIIKDEDVLDFLCHNEVLARAFDVQKKTGLSTVAILTQKGLESRWGQSSLCLITKNLGNIKCFNKSCKKHNIKLSKKGQKGNISSHCVQLWDDSPKDRYVKYNTFAEGWIAYCKLIEKRYSKAANKKTLSEEFRGLQNAGYATDKSYAVKLCKVAKDKNLIELQKYIDEGYTITTYSGEYELLKQ